MAEQFIDALPIGAALWKFPVLAKYSAVFAQYARQLNLLSKSDSPDITEHLRADKLKEVVHVFVESSDGSTTASSAVADYLVETLSSAGKHWDVRHTYAPLDFDLLPGKLVILRY